LFTTIILLLLFFFFGRFRLLFFVIKLKIESGIFLVYLFPALNLINKNKYNNRSKNIISKNELFQKQSIINKTREIMAFNDDELNQLSYELALKYDNRTYCEYYSSLIKTKHNLIFSFCYNNDYNSKIIKIYYVQKVR
jgi:hypothetical protein